MKKQYIPVGDRILVERIEPLSETKGGIIVPQAYQMPEQQGVVAAVGEGELILQDGKWVEKPMPVKVGDHVIFGKYTGIQILPPDAPKSDLMVCMRADDVICIVRDIDAS